MKRVLAVLLCLLCAMLLLVACGDNNTDTDNQGNNNTDNQGHTHTYKTNEDWSKDAQGHWYDATCDCEDAPITKLNHTDANNDGACDVCTFTNHEHEYTEDWTADCTNHWNAADCGHTVAGINVGAHVDEDADGKCDVCNYIIEDLHEHIYATEWTYGDGYHWHAALCEHKVEVADKAACNVNDAGVCTVCNATIKEIDKTDILAILKAAIANNFKVTSGNVTFVETVYGPNNAIENKGTDKVFFVLGNSDSYILLENYGINDNFIGGEQQYFEKITDEEIFGIKVVTGSNKLEPTTGDPKKLSGYNYIPGSILAAGYDDTTTLAQTLANFYDLMVNGENISNVVSNYDEKTGKYSFAYQYLAVNATEQHASDGSGGEAIMDYQVYLYNVKIEFSVDNNYVVNLANIEVESFRNWEYDQDLTYDPETNTVTMLPTADATVYTYEVSQVSGERTYTTIYPRAAFMPIDFELSFVTGTDYNSAGQMYVTDEVAIVDIDGDGIADLTVDKQTYIRLHVGNIIPSSAIPSFMNLEDFRVTFENVEGNGTPWGKAEYYQAPEFSGYMDCITFRTQDPGKYIVTISFGSVEKKISLTIPGEPVIVAPDDTDDTKYVIVTETWILNDKYTFTAKESGTYTFTLPEGLGFIFEDAELPEYDPFDPYATGGEHTVEFKLAKGKSITFFVGATEKGLYEIAVAFVAGDVDDGGDDNTGDDNPPAGELDIKGTYKGTFSGKELTVTIDETTATFSCGGYDLVTTYEIIDGKVKLYNADGIDISSMGMVAINITDGVVTSVTYNGTSGVTVTKDGAEEGGDSGEDPVVPPTPSEPIDIIGSYEGSGIKVIIDAEKITFETSSAASYDYAIEDGKVVIYNAYTGQPWASSMLAVNLTDGQVTSVVYNAKSYTVTKVEAGGDEEEPEVDPLKESLHLFMPNNGTYDFMFLTSDGAYLVNIYTSEFDMYFTYELEDNGDGSYTMTATYADLEDLLYNEEYIAIVEASAFVLFYDGSEWTMEGQGSGDSGDDYEADPLKEAVLGIYPLGGYYASVYYFDGYYVNVYDDNWTVDLYFTFDVIDNEDGTYKIILTHDPRDYEAGSDKVAELVALDFIVTPEVEEEGDKTPVDALNGTYVDNAFNGLSVGFAYDDEAWAYFLNVWGGTQDLYYYAIPTENEDGSVSLALTLCEDHWSYWGNPVTDEYELNGKTVIATPNGDSWTFAIGGQAPVVTPDGSFNNPYALEENNTCEFPGGWNYIFYAYTPATNGTLTITVTSNDFYWGYGYGEYALDNVGTVATKAIEVTAGKTIYIGMSTNSADVASINFTATFVEGKEAPDVPPATEDGSESNPFSLVMGENSLLYKGYAYAWALYKYTATEDGVLTITMTSTNFDLGYGSSPMMINGSQNSPLAINLTAGQTIWVGITTESGSQSDTPITFTASFGNGEGDDVTEEAREVDLVLGNNNVNAENITFVYTADNAVKLEIAVGNYVMNNVDVAYSVNGGTAIAIAQASSVKVDLNQGDVLKIFATTKGGYVTISASEVVIPTIEMDGTGAENDPYIIPSIPYEFSFNGAHDVYVQFTAEKAGTYILTYAQGCYVTGMPSSAIKDSANFTYTFDMEAGATLMFNPWKTSGSDVYTYSIKMVEKEEEPSNEMTGTGTSNDPYVFPTIPYEISFTGAHDVYVQFTATEAGTYILTYSSGCYVTGMPSAAIKDSVNCTYTFDMAAGETLKINPWKMSGSDVYTYSIKKADAPDVEEPGEGGEGEGGGVSGSAETYVNGNVTIVIDKSADLLQITRNTTTYVYSYSATYALANNGVVAGTVYDANGNFTNVMNLTFNDDGTVKSFVWYGQTYTHFVKQ